MARLIRLRDVDKEVSDERIQRLRDAGMLAKTADEIVSMLRARGVAVRRLEYSNVYQCQCHSQILEQAEKETIYYMCSGGMKPLICCARVGQGYEFIQIGDSHPWMPRPFGG